MIRKLVAEVLNLVAPPLCGGCGRRLAGAEEVLCMECMLSLPRARRADCEAVMLPVLEAAGCQAGVAASWVRYSHDSAAGRIIRNIKYDGRMRSGRTLGAVFARELAANPEYADTGRPGLADVDVLLPMPLHWTRQLKRGYNQSEWIAIGIAEVADAIVADNLRAVRRHPTQTHRHRQERMLNVSGTLGVIEPHELDGLNVAIVDDIVTTGATVTEAVLAIARSGARPASLGILSLGLAGS